MTEVSIVDVQDSSASIQTDQVDHERMDIDNSMPGENADKERAWGYSSPQVLREKAKVVTPDTQWNRNSDFPKS